MRTLVLQHEPGEGPGTLGPLIPGHRVVRAFDGDAVPRAVGPDERLVALGGGMGVRDAERLPWLREEIALIARAVEANRPVLGICLGSQLLAAALGARVERAPRKELGFYRVKLEPAAQADPLFTGAPDSFVALHWHGDAFELPAGAVNLASSTMTPAQAFRFGGRAWGVEFHLEASPGTLASMIATGADELRDEGVDPAALAAQAERELPRLAEVARGIFERFLALP